MAHILKSICAGLVRKSPKESWYDRAAGQTIRVYRGLRLIRQLFSLAQDPLKHVGRLNTSADIHIFNALGKDVAYLTDPLLINDMLVDREGAFEKGVFYDRVRRLAGNGVVLANGTEHSRQREYLGSFFKRDHVSGLRDLMTDVVREELTHWDRTLNIDAALHRMTFKILAVTMFGSDIDREGFDQIHEWLGMVLEAIMFRTVVPDWYIRIPTKRNRQHDTAMDQLRSAITKAMNSPAADDSQRIDLISVMRTVQRSDGKPLTAEEMSDQIVAVTMAGAETAATAMSWLAIELADNQTLQNSLRDELTHLRERGVGYGPDLTEAPLLKNVFSEVLRCRQPILVISRRTVCDTELRGVKLPQGTEVMYSPWAMHRDRKHFPPGPTFEPDTFGVGGCPIKKGSYTPFGLGPRHCVGEQYAWQMMWIVVAEILTAVQIESAVAQHPDGRPLATIIPGAVNATVRRLSAESRLS